MKIRFAIISSVLLAQVQAEVDILLRAVNAGDMDGVDVATERLLDMIVDCTSIDLSEDEWRKLLNEIRAKNPEFQSSYLLPGEVCVTLFPTIAASDCVLEIPIDGDMGEEGVDV